MTIDQHNSVYHVYSVLNSVNWSEMCGFADVLTVLQLSPTRSTTGTIAKIRCQEVDISIIDRYNSFDNRYGFFVSNGNTNHNEVWQMSPQLCCGDFYKISLWFCQFNLAYQKQYHHPTLQFSSSEPDHIITMKFGRCHHSSAVVTSTKFHCDLVNSTWLITRNIITLPCSSAPQSLITSSQWSLADVTTALLWWLLQNFTVILSVQPGLPEAISSPYSAVQLLRAWSHHHNEVWQMSPQLCCGDFYKISLWFGQFNLAYHKKYHHTTLQFSSSEPDHIITMKFGRCHHSSAVVTSTKFHCDFVSSTWLTRSNIITLLCSSAPQSLITSSQWSLADVTTALLWWLLQNFTVIWSIQPGLSQEISSHYPAVQLLRAWSHHHNEVWQMSPQLCCGDFYKISLWFCQFNLAYQKQYHHPTLQFSSSEPDHIITMKFGRCHHSSAVVTSTKFHCDLVNSTWLITRNIITLPCSSAPQSLITSSQWSLADVTTALLLLLLQNFTVIKQQQWVLVLVKTACWGGATKISSWSYHFGLTFALSIFNAISWLLNSVTTATLSLWNHTLELSISVHGSCEHCQVLPIVVSQTFQACQAVT